MSYYSVKDGILRQNDNTTCSESTVKNAMMNGGSILYDLYQDDVLFLPRNSVSNRPTGNIVWGNAINVDSTEIYKVSSIIKVAEAVKSEAQAGHVIDKVRESERLKAKALRETRKAKEAQAKANKQAEAEAKAKERAKLTQLKTDEAIVIQAQKDKADAEDKAKAQKDKEQEENKPKE